jgi:hypothetical protein
MHEVDKQPSRCVNLSKSWALQSSSTNKAHYWPYHIFLDHPKCSDLKVYNPLLFWADDLLECVVCSLHFKTYIEILWIFPYSAVESFHNGVSCTNTYKYPQTQLCLLL